MKRGVSLIVFSCFSPLLAQILSSSFINFLQNFPLLIDFVTDFTPFAPVIVYSSSTFIDFYNFYTFWVRTNLFDAF